jgi:hypothetical protein
VNARTKLQTSHD